MSVPSLTIPDAAWARRLKRLIASKIDHEGATIKVPAGTDVVIEGDRYIGTKGANSVMGQPYNSLSTRLRRRFLDLSGLGWESTKWISRRYNDYLGIDDCIYLHDGGAIGGEGHGLYEGWQGNHTLRNFVAERIPSQVLQISARHFHVPKGSTIDKGWLETLWPQLFEEPGEHLVENFYVKDWGWGAKASFAFSYFGTETQDPVRYPIGPHGSGVTLRNGRMVNNAQKLGANAGTTLAQRRPFLVIDNVRMEVENTGPNNAKPLILSEGTKRVHFKNSHFRCSRAEIGAALPGELKIDGCDGGALLVINGVKHKTLDALQQPFQV